MAKSFRQFVESVIYAGMKPDMPPSQARTTGLLGPLRALFEKLLNGAAPDDPFYLTNRTLGERAKVWLLIALPILFVAGVIGIGVWGYIEKRDSAPQELTPQEAAAKMLPDLNKPMELSVNRDLEVLEARVKQGEPVTLVGSIRNVTDKTIGRTEVVFDLTDARGSRLGAVSVPLESVAPQQVVKFELPIEQRTAAFALRRTQ